MLSLSFVLKNGGLFAEARVVVDRDHFEVSAAVVGVEDKTSGLIEADVAGTPAI
jgi:hypothetical protein